jgi:putative peptidoglycan lipid II flippase
MQRLLNVGRLAAVAGVSRVPGFLIPLLIASVFGAGPETDAYFLAYSAVLLVAGTIAQALEVAIVPFAARALGPGGAGFPYVQAAGRRGLQASIGPWALAAVAVAVLAGGVQPQRVLFYALCFTPLALAWPVASAFAGALVARLSIASASASLLWRGGGALLGLVLAPTGAGLWAVALGLGVGEAMRVWWLRRRVGFGAASAGLDLRPLMVSAVAMGVAGAIGSTAAVVERLLASSLPAGAVSHLEYASKVLIVPAVVFDGALAPLALAGWSRAVAAGGLPSGGRVARAVLGALAVATILAVLLSSGAAVLVGLLLQRGQFGAGDTAVVAGLLRVLLMGFVASSAALVLERLFLAAARSRPLASLALLRGGVRIAVAATLLGPLGLPGLVIGYVAAEWAYLGALAWRARGLFREAGARP